MPFRRCVAAGLTLSALAAAGAVAGCSAAEETVDSAEGAASKLRGTTAAERREYLRTAAIHDAAELRALGGKDLLNGPPNALGLRLNSEVSCTFRDLASEADRPGGKTPKFECVMADGTVVKVKYSGKGRRVDETDITKLEGDSDDNNEIYGEVMSTRLQWALGYAADAVYPVRVTCANCPENPWQEYKNFPHDSEATQPTKRDTRRFNFAVIEIKREGKKIEEVVGVKKERDPETGEEKEKEVTKDGQGWGWKEIDALRRGEPEWEAYRLLAAFMGHSDNKPGNQRLVCDPGAITDEGKCKSPRLVMQDVGAGFGGMGFLGLMYKKANLEKWEKPLWKDLGSCTARLDIADIGPISFGAELEDPRVTEEARALLARRMNLLSREQVETIFRASRIEERKDHTTVAEWVQAFDKKRDELNRACGQPAAPAAP